MKLNLTILGLCLLGLLLTQTLAYHESKKLKMEHETEEDPKATEEVAKAPQAAPGKASGAQTPNLKGAAGRKAAVQDKKTVYKTKSELEEEKESNNKASQIFTSKPEGRDGFDVVVEGELTLQLLEAGKEDEAPALPYHFRLNKNALYYSDRSRSYRGVFGAFPIENMVSGDDVPESGKCCSRLSPVKQAKIKQSGRLVSLSCFKLTGTVETWNLCSKDDNLIRDWNKKLKIQIIVSALIKKGKTNVEVMIPDDKTCENNNDWTWRGQNDWKCMCKDGKNQSPLVLSTEKSKNVMNTRLVWNYVPVNNAQAKFNGHEVEVFGEFGKFVKQKVDSQKTYSAYKVSFKFPSEHMIDGNKYDGEILVHHKDEEDKPAILSILLIEDFSNEAEDNEFIDNVDAETWKHDELASIAIESKPSLEQIVRGGATKFLKKSFFWYQGSTTTPPCEENVLHVVMRDPVKVPSAQFQIIRKVAFPNNDESEGNARKPFEPNDREVSVHLDMSPTCENSQTHALIQDVEDKITEEASKDANKESDSVPQKFVKATNTIASYGMTGGEPITGDIGNGITLNIVKPDEVPEKTKKNLVKEATEIYKSIKRRAAEEAKLEVDAKNKEAALKKSTGDNGGDVKAAEQEIQAEVVKALNRYY